MCKSQSAKNHNIPSNKGILVGQKLPLKLKEIWSIRIRLQLTNHTRELALFNLAIDSISYEAVTLLNCVSGILLIAVR